MYSVIKKRISRISSKLLLTDGYKKYYFGNGIGSEDNETNNILFSVSLARDEEDPTLHNEEEALFAEFVTYRFNEFLGINYNEFMELTRARKDSLIPILKEKIKIEAEIKKAQENELKELTQGGINGDKNRY